MSRLLRIAHSPDPDDAFMFYGLSQGEVTIENFTIQNILEDIETLNQRALKAQFEITAISAHLYPFVANHYWIMRTGSSMGEGYGPVVIAKKRMTLKSLKGKRVAHPGEYTTASLLLRLYADDVDLVSLPFDKIMDAVRNGDVDAGVIIHEGQITYEKEGFQKVVDFGELWEEETQLPLPLGLDVVRKDLGWKLAATISAKLRESIRYGYEHLDEATAYALQYGRGIGKELGEKFVKMYVSELTIEMGEKVIEAIELLYSRAADKMLIPNIPPIDLV
jgi:1,4-dihydroxy-6-naphthoate synthase